MLGTKTIIMRELTLNQMTETFEGGNFIHCAVSSTGYGIAAASFALVCLELAPLAPFVIAAGSVYMAAVGVKSNC